MKFLNTYHTCSYTENFALNKYDCYYSFENKWRRSIGGNRRYNEGAYYYHINLSKPRSGFICTTLNTIYFNDD